jgi:hypothetical protein
MFGEKEEKQSTGDLVPCKWCGALPWVIYHNNNKEGIDYCTIECRNTQEECAALPATTCHGFDMHTKYIASIQWTLLNSNIPPEEAKTDGFDEKLRAEYDRIMAEYKARKNK